jgi:hypothetical protein
MENPGVEFPIDDDATPPPPKFVEGDPNEEGLNPGDEGKLFAGVLLPPNGPDELEVETGFPKVEEEPKGPDGWLEVPNEGIDDCPNAWVGAGAATVD